MEEPEMISPPPPMAMPAAGGLSDNAAGALAYITIIPAIVFLVIEPYNKKPFVRFHAFQCLGLAVAWFAVSLLMIIPILGWILGFVGMVVLFCAWILCIVKASRGELFKLPVLGNFVEGLAK